MSTDTDTGADTDTQTNPAIADATRAQNRAADPALSIWVSANAGTGKTRVLTGRILRLLLDGARITDILAVTYTRAAAAEMRDRLYGMLARWAVMDGTELEASLRAIGIAAPTLQQRDRARMLFATMLDAPQPIRIETVHAFAQSVLRRFPVEAGIDPRFEVATPVQLAALKAGVVGAVLRDPRPHIARAVLALARSMPEVVLTEQLTALLAGRGEGHHYLRDAVPAERHLYTALTDDPDGIMPDPAAAMRRMVIEAVPTGEAAAALARIADAMGAGKSGEEAKRGAMIKTWLTAPPDERPGLWQDYTAVYLTGGGEIRKRLATKTLLAACPDGGDVLQREAEHIRHIAAGLHGIATARQTAPLLVVAEAMAAGYGAAKAKAGFLDYDDLIVATGNLLAHAGGRAWVRYKLDRGINHLLIDEAQDTSPGQWDILTTLAEEFFTGEKEGREAPLRRTLFSVGDFKQSIYSFQGAEPRLFEETEARFGRLAESTEKPFERVELNVSFRSTAPVLQLVDGIMAEGLPGIGGATRHAISRIGAGGFLDLAECIEPAGTNAEDSDAAEAELVARLAATIKAWIGRRELPSRGRKVRAGDILILVRKRGGFRELLDRGLNLAGLPVAGADRIKLVEDIAVQDMLALGRAMLLPQDDLTLATVLKSPLFNLTEEDIFRLAHGRRKGESVFMRLAAMAAGDARVARAHEFFTRLLESADTMTPYGFFSHVLDADMRVSFAKRLGNHVRDVLAEFLEQARGYEEIAPASMLGFIHFMEASDTEITRETGTRGGDEIRIMTIHGAKGLEAPIVILPDTLRPGRWIRQADRLVNLPVGDGGMTLPTLPASGHAVRHEAITAAREAMDEAAREEDNRLFYVALTRAEDGVLVAGYGAARRRMAEGSWYEKISKCFDTLSQDVQSIDETASGGFKLRRFESPQMAEVAPDPAPAAKGEDAPIPDWAGQAAPAEAMPPKPITPSGMEALGYGGAVDMTMDAGEAGSAGDAVRDTDSDTAATPPESSPQSPLTPARRRAMARGSLAHRMLEILPGLAGVARGRAAEQLIANATGSGLMENAAAREVLAEVEVLMAEPELAAIFGPASRSEVPVAGMLGGFPVHGVIDRLVVEDDCITLIDFKTGTAPVSAPLPRAHLRQLALYRGLLGQIWPGRRLRTGLLYTAAAQVFWVQDTDLKGFLSDIPLDRQPPTV